MYTVIFTAAALGLTVPAHATATVEGAALRPVQISNDAGKGDSLETPWVAKADMLSVARDGAAISIPGMATIAFQTAPGQSLAVRIPELLVSVE